MGCDIHLYTEHWDRDSKSWKASEPWITTTKHGETSTRVPYHLQPSCDRNYNFFSWLADVRNRTWGETIPVIKEAKGFPEDACPEISQSYEEWNGDAHTPSFLTLTELQEGWAKIADQKLNFYACPMGPNSNPEGDKKFEEWKAKPEDERGEPPYGYYAVSNRLKSYKWSTLVTKQFERNYEKLTEYLRNQTYEYDVNEDEVRAVFWFDN